MNTQYCPEMVKWGPLTLTSSQKATRNQWKLAKLTSSELWKIIKDLQQYKQQLFRKMATSQQGQWALWHLNLTFEHHPVPSHSVVLRANSLTTTVVVKVSSLRATEGSKWVWSSPETLLPENCHSLTHLAVLKKLHFQGFFCIWSNQNVCFVEESYPQSICQIPSVATA